VAEGISKLKKASGKIGHIFENRVDDLGEL
jgi:hypothetical protein